MVKNSTLHYSIHNLGSQIKHEVMSCDEFAITTEFNDVIKLIGQVPAYDVRQEVVDNILSFAEDYIK